jgi:hypothetical protein
MSRQSYETHRIPLPAALPWLAVLVIVAAIPLAIWDTLRTGRVYFFPRQFRRPNA